MFFEQASVILKRVALSCGCELLGLTCGPCWPTASSGTSFSASWIMSHLIKTNFSFGWNPTSVCVLGLWEKDAGIIVNNSNMSEALLGSLNMLSYLIFLIIQWDWYLLYRWRNVDSESHLLWVNLHLEVLFQKLGKQAPDVSLIPWTPSLTSMGKCSWVCSSKYWWLFINDQKYLGREGLVVALIILG